MGSKLDSHQTLHDQSQYRERAHIRVFVVAYRAGLRDPVFRSLTFEGWGGAFGNYLYSFSSLAVPKDPCLLGVVVREH